MKKNMKKVLLTLGTTVALGAVSLTAPAVLESFTGETVVQAAEYGVNAVEVSTIEQFENALKNASVTEIKVVNNISFRKNIVDIPNRDLTITANPGVVVNSGHNSIYGKQNYKGMNTLTIKDITIQGADGDGRFFTGGAGNGPSSRGWDVYAEGVNYTGARFVHLSEGKLTFGGTNNITTRAENAWVHELEFLPGSVYNGIAANKDHGQFSAFYFNGRLVNGKATGTVEIGDEAQVNVKIGPQSKVNHYYPVFYDKVYKVNVGESAELNVDAAGVAFQFIPRADYLEKTPSLNLAEFSRVKLNGRGGGNYATMKLQYYGTSVNMEPQSELLVSGESTKAVIESEYKGANFNLNNPSNFMVENRKPGSKLFYSTKTQFNGDAVYRISAWNQTGGEYNREADHEFDGIENGLNIEFGKICNSKVLQSNLSGFDLPNYGKIELQGGII